MSDYLVRVVQFKQIVLFSLFFLVSVTPSVYGQELINEKKAWSLGWPSMQGPFGNFQVPPTGAVLVDDLADARLLWESEDRDSGRAKHTTGIFKAKTPEEGQQKILDVLGPMPRATPGGWAAPIVAEGKLFVSTFKPAGKLYRVQSLYGGSVQAHLEANDLLIALDAKSGKTLWKAAEPGGFVWGVGKRQGFQVAPVYHAGVVYSMGTTGRIYAYSAADGKKKWATMADPQMLVEKEKHLSKSDILQASTRYGWQQSLIFASKTLVVSRKTDLRGLDPTNGKVRWELPNVNSPWSTPAVWNHSGRDYLLTATGGKPGEAKLHLIDPSVGRIVWTVEGLHSTQFNLVVADDHVFVNVGSSIMNENANASAPKDDNGLAPFGLLGAYRISPEGASRVWTLPDKPHFLIPTQSDSMARPRVVVRNGLVYHTTAGPNKEADRRFVVARLGDGEVLVDNLRENDFWFQVIEDKLLYCRDWCHGKSATWYLYRAEPKDFRQLSGPWATAEPLTTSYQVLMEPPVVAGRIFFRTETGTIVCYDLRK